MKSFFALEFMYGHIPDKGTESSDSPQIDMAELFWFDVISFILIQL